ncbi:transposase DDE domain protein [mine drainage metagenome]|uniref:Transposase DDE domain protein n=1 Tax=mine drainage metagenome TaxID=410659 RepID=A0A1J5QMV7_9ZZZZ
MRHDLLATVARLGGDHNDPNPIDRGKLGGKRHVLVDQRGRPLVAMVSAANVHDSRMLQPLILALPAVAGLSGRPRKRPGKLHIDKGYNDPCCRRWLRGRGITPRIARRAIESSSHLGKHHRVIARTLGWLHRLRRLRIRYERRAGIHQAFLTLGRLEKPSR